jgi:hypothetical protein
MADQKSTDWTEEMKAAALGISVEQLRQEQADYETKLAMAKDAEARKAASGKALEAVISRLSALAAAEEGEF